MTRTMAETGNIPPPSLMGMWAREVMTAIKNGTLGRLYLGQDDDLVPSSHETFVCCGMGVVDPQKLQGTSMIDVAVARECAEREEEQG